MIEAERFRGRRALATLLPAALAGVLGLLGASAPALWADELATWGAVTAPSAGLWAQLGEIDAVLAPYYLLMRGWTALAGTSDLALRLPSVLGTAAAAGLTGALGTRLAGTRTGLVAGALFAILPGTSRYAQEARPYALAVCAAVAATILLVRAMERPGAARWSAYAAAVAVLGLLHVVALLLLPAHGIAVALARRGVIAWLASAVAGCLPVLPLLWLGVRQRAQIDWIPAVAADRLTTTPSQVFGTTLIGGLVIGLGLLAVSLRAPAAVPTLWALVPAAGLLAASAVLDLWLGRYLLFTVPAWALLAALALRGTTVARAAAVLACVGVLALPAQLDLRAPDGHDQATRELAAVVATQYLPGDVVVHGTSTRGEDRVSRDLVERYVPADRRPVDVLLARPLRTDGLRATECTGCLGTPPRIWLVRSGERADPLGGLDEAKRAALAPYRAERVWHLTGLTLALLVRA
ncbi:MAG: glycosyltransferase family 39 protein [Dehalococcoidia bacterium]